MAIDNKIFNNSCNWLTDHNQVIPSAVKFWIYLIVLIPSIICSVFVLYGFLSNPTLRSAVHNHAIIIFLSIGLVYELTIYPWMLHFYHQEHVWKRPPLFCIIWAFLDWGLYFTQTMLFAWATMERHILIFHDKWVSTRRKRLLAHYLPLITLTLYCLIFYTIVIVFPPCKNTFNDYNVICVDLCLWKSLVVSTYDSVVHQIIPILTIIISSVGLLLHVYWQKHCVGRSLQWRKHWKMTVQLLLISLLYLILAFPITLTSLLHVMGLRHILNYHYIQYALFLNYCTMLICPIALAFLLPQLRNQRNIILRSLCRTTAVTPIT